MVRSWLCCFFAKNRIEPASFRNQLPSGMAEKRDKISRGIKQERILLPTARKMPAIFQKLVLQEFSGWMYIPTIHGAVPFFFIFGCLFLVCGA